jgi:predicted HTH transcriptional regulator
MRLEKKVTHEKMMQATLPELAVQILELAKNQGRVTLSDVVKAHNANRNTVKAHLRKLVASGQLYQQGSGRGAWYVQL